jgi:hypothetical protein
MPCYRCGVRQVDPDRGESPWKRGVRADRQVLVCPACQASFDWTGDLDRCPVCASAHLVRRLGEIECRDCGYVREPGAVTGAGVPDVAGAASDSLSGGGGTAGPDPEPGFGETPGLAEEVELALERVLGRSGRPARIG